MIVDYKIPQTCKICKDTAVEKMDEKCYNLDIITMKITMTPKEKLNRNIWWVLQAIKYEELICSKNEPIGFSIEKSEDSPSVKDQRRIIHKLDSFQVIEILELDNDDENFYGLFTIQPKFDEFYNLYEKKLIHKLKAQEQKENDGEFTVLEKNELEFLYTDRIKITERVKEILNSKTLKNNEYYLKEFADLCSDSTLKKARYDFFTLLILDSLLEITKDNNAEIVIALVIKTRLPYEQKRSAFGELVSELSDKLDDSLIRKIWAGNFLTPTETRLFSDKHGIYSLIKIFDVKVKFQSENFHAPEKNNHIEKLLIVRPWNENNIFLIVVNDNYQNLVIKGDKAKESWELLFKVAEGNQSMETHTYKANLDYFNTNKACKLYTRTGCSITKILRSEAGVVVPAIPMEIISEKAFKQRQKKGRKET